MIRPQRFLLVPFLTLATAAQQTWTVDDDLPADFAEVQDAVDAAADGDTLLVSPGIYGEVLVDGKGLTIVSSGAMILNTLPGAVPVFEVANLSASQELVLQGFTVFNGSDQAPAAVRVTDCAGPVWLQELFVDSYGAQAIHVRGSASVVAVATRAQTNLTAPLPDGTPQPGPGARVEGGSSFFAYDSDFLGSHGAFVLGGPVFLTSPPDGGPGVLVEDSFVLLSASTATGGSGNSIVLDGCSVSGDGGDGLVLRTAGGGPPVAELRDAVVDGGFPGFFDPTCAPTPAMGVAFDVQAGSLTDTVGTARTLAAPARASAGTALEVDLLGQPFDLGVLFASGGPAPALGLLGLEVHLGLTNLIQVATIPLGSDGLEEVTLPLPGLPPGAASVRFGLQALFLESGGALRVSGPSALVLD